MFLLNLSLCLLLLLTSQESALLIHSRITQLELIGLNTQAGDGFGSSVAISNDIVVAVGSFPNINQDPEAGAVYLFYRNSSSSSPSPSSSSSSSQWVQFQELYLSPGVTTAAPWFGYAIDIVSNNNNNNNNNTINSLSIETYQLELSDTRVDQES